MTLDEAVAALDAELALPPDFKVDVPKGEWAEINTDWTAWASRIRQRVRDVAEAAVDEAAGRYQTVGRFKALAALARLLPREGEGDG